MRKVRKSGKLVHGVGINDADYEISINKNSVMIWMCPFYRKWSDMLRRCYYEKSGNKNPHYLGCSVAPEWHYFMTFRAWMETQDWEGKQLDKDLLIPGNREYGPDTCLLIDQRTNSFIIEARSKKSPYKTGVSFSPERGKFCAYGKDFQTGKTKNLGRYETEDEAHEAWLAEKLRQANILAAEQTDPRVAKALISRYENYQ